jgi:tRNA A37 methylthiotransferase MiaB
MVQTDSRKVCIHFVMGCPRSRVDHTLLRRYLAANGWQFTDDPKAADLLVLSECGVTNETAFRSLRFAEIMEHKRKPGAKVVVTGCLAGMSESQELRRHGILALLPRDKTRWDELIGATVPLARIEEPNLLEGTSGGDRCFTAWERFQSYLYPSVGIVFNLLNRRWDTARPVPFDALFNIRVGKGCLDECTYCALRKAHGTLVSKPLEQVVGELRSGVQQGHRKITLVGADVGAWGQDTGSNVVELFRGLFGVEGDYQLYIGDFNPRWAVRYGRDLTDLLAANRARIDAMLVPVQSGSDRVLERMRRGYTRREVESSLRELREALAGVRLATHVIIGFPGETDADFAETIALLNAIRFDEISIYKYSDRKGTEAEQMADKVGELRKIRRLWRYKRQVLDLRRAA